jgi:Flp pilus assembly protein TadD
MSVILDALRKAQHDRLRPGPEGSLRPGGPPEGSRKTVYLVVVAAIVVVSSAAFGLFAYNRSKMVVSLPAAPLKPNVAAQAPVQGPVPAGASAAPLRPPGPVPPKNDGKVVTKDAGKAAGVQNWGVKERAPRASSTAPDGSRRKEQGRAEASPPDVEKDAGLVSVRKNDQTSTVSAYNQAVRADEKGDTVEAKRLYLAVLRDRPNDVETLNNLGVMAMNQGNSAEALYYFRKILEIKKDYDKAYNNIGLILFNLGDKKQAESYFRGAIKSNQTSVEPYLNLSALLRSDKRLEDASQLLGLLIRRGERNPSVHLSYAIVRDEMGQTEDAIRHYRYYLREGSPSEYKKRVAERLKTIEEINPTKSN